MKKIKGLQLDYNVKRKFVQKFMNNLFGRLSVSYQTKKVYYIPGILNEIPYYKIFNGRIFIGTTSDIDFDIIMSFCSKFIISTTEKDNENLFMKTGKERLKFIAKERGYKIDWE